MSRFTFDFSTFCGYCFAESILNFESNSTSKRVSLTGHQNHLKIYNKIPLA